MPLLQSVATTLSLQRSSASPAAAASQTEEETVETVFWSVELFGGAVSDAL
jgi:hypothetical protein